jgi:hypothetical protein
MLGDVAAPEPAPVEMPAPSRFEILNEMHSKVKDYDAALLILAKKIEQERRAASIIIVADLEPIHRALAEDLLKAFLALHEANLRYADFTDHVNQDRISWGSIDSMSPWFIGHPRSRDSQLSQYLNDACELGYLPRVKLPAEFQ